MKTWLRRLLYALLLLVWLVIILFPGFDFFLAANGQIELGKDPQRHVRIFLLNVFFRKSSASQYVLFWSFQVCPQHQILLFLNEQLLVFLFFPGDFSPILQVGGGIWVIMPAPRR